MYNYYGIRGRGYVHAFCWPDYEEAATVRDAGGRPVSRPLIETQLIEATGIAREVCLHCGETMIPADLRLARQLEQRCETLSRISGLRVYTQPGTTFFVFDRGYTVKTVTTYPKAKLFAEGVAIGRTYANR